MATVIAAIARTAAERRYRRRNFPHRVRGLKAEAALQLTKIGLPALLSELRATVHRADGSIEQLGVLSRRVVTDVGVQFIVNGFLNTVELENMNYHDSGTGTNAESASDTALQTPTGIARVAGTQSSPANGQYRSVATISYNASFSVTEHGLFSASTVGTLLDRSVFASIGVNSGDSIQFTYTFTIVAGN